VAAEHLDGNQYQFITISGDGLIYVWDTRFKQIANEELRHIGRSKHVPTEKQQSKGEEPKLLWAPIFRAPLKRSEGVGELSLSKLFSPHASLGAKVASATEQTGEVRSHLVITAEEGDLMYVDLTVAKSGGDHGHDDEDDAKDAGTREFIAWTVPDHVRPAVALCMSPFFPDVILTVADSSFHIWRVGRDQPLFVSPNHSHRITCGAWSPTRPSVVILADATGHLQTWDFSDSSSKPSLELKATHEHICSMEFMPGANSRQQLLAIGDEVGTLHVYELPRGLIRSVPREQEIMQAFLDREWAHIQYLADVPPVPGFDKRDVRNFGSAAAATGGEGDEDETEGDDAPVEEEKAADTGAAADGMGGGDEEEDVQESAASKAAAAKQAAREQAKKEEEEFLRMEAAFIAELGLSQEEVPEGLRDSWKAPE
jgi:hypothetical protein